MDKSEILNKLQEIQRLQREIEDMSKFLNIGDIKQDKIYVGLQSYKSVLKKILKEG